MLSSLLFLSLFGGRSLSSKTMHPLVNSPGGSGGVSVTVIAKISPTCTNCGGAGGNIGAIAFIYNENNK